MLDPVIGGPRSMRNHAYLVLDTLYGIDTNWMAQPQMVEEHQVEEDGLTWTLRLRHPIRIDAVERIEDEIGVIARRPRTGDDWVEHG